VAVIQLFNGKKILFSKRNELISIISASIIGLISPLPTYAAIPIGVSLMGSGIPFSAVMAFVITSPLINPSIFFLTLTQISPHMAIARVISAFIIGLTGGLLTKKIFNSDYIGKYIKTPEKKIKTKRSILMEIYKNILYVGKTFSIAILISSAVKALVPAEIILHLFNNHNSGMLMAIALGIPFYTCGGASIPLIQTLMEMGMGKGAVLAFFIAGPATKLETLYAYKKILGLKVLIFFLVLTFTFSYLAGIIFSYI
jgi:uncharacterized protein